MNMTSGTEKRAGVASIGLSRYVVAAARYVRHNALRTGVRRSRPRGGDQRVQPAASVLGLESSLHPARATSAETVETTLDRFFGNEHD